MEMCLDIAMYDATERSYQVIYLPRTGASNGICNSNLIVPLVAPVLQRRLTV